MQTKNTTAEQAMSKIEASAQECSADQREDFIRTIGPKQAVRQGDVLLILANPHVKTGKPLGTRQVAVGATVGARHIAEGPVEVLSRVGAGPLEGPIVQASGRRCLTHPEHANKSMPAGDYEVLYQLDMRTKRAVVD